MGKINLVKSLTRVINTTSLPFRARLFPLSGKTNSRKKAISLRLLILCLSLAVFGVEGAWGRQTNYLINESPNAEMMTSGSGSKEKIYSISKPGAIMVFSARKHTWGATGGVYLYGYTDTNCSQGQKELKDLTGLEDSNNGTSSGDIKIDRKYKSFKFKGHGTLKKTLLTVSLTQATYLEVDNVEGQISVNRDFGTAQINADNSTSTFVVNYSNVDNMSISITGDGASQYSVNKSSITGGKGSYGNETITITYKHDVAGEHKAVITVSDGTSSITVNVSGTTTKKNTTMSWNTGTNVMNVGDVFTTEALTYSDALRPIVFTTSNAEVIKINNEGYPEAVGVGKATITATQEETTEFYETSASQEITVTNKQKQLIEWEDKLSFKYEGSQFTQTLTASANTNITYSLSDVTNNCVSLSGSVLTIKNYGTAYVTATAAETDDYVGVSMTRKVIIRDPNAACETIIFGPSSEFDLDMGWNDWGHKTVTKEISFTGEPRSMVVEYIGEPETHIFDYYTGAFIIYEYYDGNWHELKNLGKLQTDSWKSTTLTLNRKTTKVQFKGNEGMGHFKYRNVTIYLAKYLEVSTNTLGFDAQAGISSTKTFNVNYSDVQGPVEITSSNNDILSFSPSSFDADCEQHGSQQITVTFNSPTEINSISETITVSNGVEPALTINVSGKVTKRKQDIIWNDGTSYNSTDLYTLTATATSNLTVTYEIVSGPGQIVNNNQIQFTGSGQVQVTAKQAGNDYYNPAADVTKTFTVSKVTPTISTNPTASAITYGQKLSESNLAGGQASVDGFRGTAGAHNVEGSFVWANGDYIVVENAGSHEYDVTFTPSGTEAAMYNNASSKASVMVNKATPTLVVQNPVDQKFYVNDELTPKLDLVTCIESYSAESDAYGHTQAKLAINYTCNQDGAFITGDKKFYATKLGTYTITATAPETDYFNSVEKTFTITVIKYQPTIDWTGDSSYPANSTGDVDLQLFKITPAELQSALTFTTSDATIASIVDGKLHCNKQGTVTITANYLGNANYYTAKKEQPITFAGIDDEITWNEGNELQFFANSTIPGTIAVAKSGLPITYESSDPTIVLVAENQKDMKALKQGTVSITAKTAGDAYTAPIAETKIFTINYCSQRIVMDTKDLRRFVYNKDGTVTGSPLTLSATIVDSTGNIILGQEVQFELQTNTISSLSGNTLTVTKDGTDKLKVFVLANDIYGYAENKDIEIVCRKEGEKCNTKPYVQNIETITFNTNNTKEIPFDSRPCEKVSFDIKHAWQLLETKSSTIALVSSDGKSQIILYEGNANYDGSNFHVDYDIPEGDITLYNKIKCTTGANITYTITNLEVTQRSYLQTDVKKIERTAASSNAIKVNVPYSQDIAVSYSDLPLIQYSITNTSGANLTLAPKTPEDEPVETCDMPAGTYTFTLSGFWDKVPSTTFNETISFWTSAGDKVEIPVIIEIEAGVTYTTINGGDWNDKNIWKVAGSTPGAPPTSSSVVQIEGPVTITGKAEAYMVEITHNEYVQGSLTIAPTGGLRVYAGGIYNPYPDAITIASTEENQGYLLVSPLATKDPLRASVQLATKSTLDNGANKDATWQYIGIPTAKQDFTVDYITWWYKWDEAQGWLDYKSKSDRDGSVELKPWEGYAVTQYGKPVYTWQGDLIRDDVNIPLTRTASGMQGDNLFANSYSAPIDVKQFTANDFIGDVNKTFYLFRSGSWNEWSQHQGTIIDQSTLDMKVVAPGQYIAIPALTAKDLDETKDLTMIAPMQGVYVQAGIETSSTKPAFIQLQYEKHVWNAFSNASQMNLPVRAPQMEEPEEKQDVIQDKLTRDSIRQVIEQSQTELTHRVRMVAYGEHSGADRIYILEKPSYSSEYENGYDAPKVFADVEGVLNLYTNEAETGLMSVAATNNADSMFIGFNAGEDYNYNLYITSVIGDNLELMDMQTYDRFEIKDSVKYEFAATPNSEDPYRFRIFKTNKTPDTPTSWTGLGDKAKIWYNKQVLYVSDAVANSTAEIFTAAGDLLMQVTFDYNTTISTTDIPEGIYTMRVADSVLKFFVK